MYISSPQKCLKSRKQAQYNWYQKTEKEIHRIGSIYFKIALILG